jgi:hypothetical protein
MNLRAHLSRSGPPVIQQRPVASLLATLSVVVGLTGCATARPQTTPTPARTAADTGSRGGTAGRTSPKPYKDVITARAKSDTGAFTVHQVADKWYYEIAPRDARPRVHRDLADRAHGWRPGLWR